MAKRSLKKILKSDVKPLKLDTTELLLLVSVTITLLYILGSQLNALPSILK